MILYLVLAFLIILAGATAKRKGPEYFKKFVVALAVALIALISLRFGKSLFAVIAVLFPFVLKLLNFALRNFGLFKYIAGLFRKNKTSKAANVKVSNKEAYEILGLKPGATKQEVKSQYKKLMKANHPDHGGSKHLAAMLNAAKDKLLNQ